MVTKEFDIKFLAGYDSLYFFQTSLTQPRTTSAIYLTDNLSNLAVNPRLLITHVLATANNLPAPQLRLLEQSLEP